MTNGARLSALPVQTGVGLRAPHYSDFVTGTPDTGFLEIHPENYFGGGLRRAYLEEIKKHYPISFHCVGMSLGSIERPKIEHLKKLKQLVDAINPVSISDHISWSASGNAHLNDLLPLPYTPESLSVICNNINVVQDFLGRRILVENPSVYACFKHSILEETDFINQITTRTNCGILLDINNVFVNACNNGIDAERYIKSISADAVGEIHLAGHMAGKDKTELRIDTHDEPVCDDVWMLYERTIAHMGVRPTLVEWDAKLPALDVLLNEAAKAQSIMDIFFGKMPHAAA
jgi:uncharacterized protein